MLEVEQSAKHFYSLYNNKLSSALKWHLANKDICEECGCASICLSANTFDLRLFQEYLFKENFVALNDFGQMKFLYFTAAGLQKLHL